MLAAHFIEHARIEIIFIGIIFISALFIARLFHVLKIPSVTGYILVGILLGPSVLNIISNNDLLPLEIISEIGIGLIIFTVGSEFKTHLFKKFGKKILLLSFFETFLTFILVFSGIYFLSKNFQLSLVLASIAMATAPAATMMVLREYDSDGPLTHNLLVLVGLNNLFCLICFSIIIPLVFPSESSVFTNLFDLGKSLFFGILWGLIITIWETSLNKSAHRILVSLGGVITATGIAILAGLDYMLVCFAAGATVANVAVNEKEIFNSVKKVDFLIYIIFFVVAGMKLHLSNVLSVGLIGVTYILLRISGKVLGSFFGQKITRFSGIKGYDLGMSLLCQAGLAIGLIANISSNPSVPKDFIEQISAIVLGSVVLFEIAGPLLVKYSIVKAGEVKLVSLVPTYIGGREASELSILWDKFRDSIGFPTWKSKKELSEVQVKHVMRRNIETILDTSTFDDISKFISHSKYDLFPVVSKEKEFVGVIPFQEIRGVIYEPHLSHLLIARDLVSFDCLTLKENDTLEKALDVFHNHMDVVYIPVVSGNENNKLVGMITQHDILHVMHKKDIRNESS